MSTPAVRAPKGEALADPAIPGPGVDPLPEVPVATLIPPDSWTARLADLLHRDPSDITDAAVQSLLDTLATGDPTADQTRHTLLRLLARRRAQSGPSHAPPVPAAALPRWPTEPPTPFPPFHPGGLAGTSLVSICHDGSPATALASWLATTADEIVLVDWSAKAQPTDLPTDPRLRVIRIEGPELSPAQAFNAGFRLARHQRIVALAAAVELGPDYLGTPPTPGEFRTSPGPSDGSGVLLDLNRRDLARSGGFNEYLDTADFLLDDLVARLIAQGLRPAPARHFSAPPAPAPLRLDEGSLRHCLQHSPGFAALRNRFIAAIMPDWSASKSRAFRLAEIIDHNLTLHPAAAPALKPSLLLRAAAENHALIDLVARHIGGAPVMLNSRRLDIVLNRPANDVCALDVALASGPEPDLVTTRRAWLVVDIDASALPLPGNPAQTAFASLKDLARNHQMTLIVRLPDDSPNDLGPLLSDHPLVAPDADLTQGFRPVTLRDLNTPPSGPPLPHGTMAFNAQTVADFAALAARGPAILLRRPKLFIDAQHGLGNRLRAVASAGAISWATGRELVIIWQPDAHCACRYDDLFEPTGAILNQGFHTEAAAMDIDLYNYMEVEPGSIKNQPIALGAFRDAYLRSACPLVSPHSSWSSENDWLSHQRLGPVVLDLVNRLRNPNALSVHIRMEGGTAAEHLPYESPANWSAAAHREIDHWRKRSHFSYFQTRLDQLIAEGQADSVFLASDTPAVYDAFAARYGDRISGQPRRASDRSTQAIVHALADAILLSRAPRLLGSTYSSFTELANRLATQPIAVELCGRDF